jgi:hypothetical protein
MVPKRVRRGGRFFGRRLNLEYVLLLPAGAVRRVLDDPRKVPYLLAWKSERDGKVKEAVRLARYHDPHDFTAVLNHVELKRSEGDDSVLRFVWRPEPRNGGRMLLLVCSYCKTPQRYVYGWEWDGYSGWSNRVRRIDWRCRLCARLRYSSEGGYLCPVRAFRALGNLPRPSRWFPYVFSSPAKAAAAGFCSYRT